MQSVANVSVVPSPYRTKVTLACDACRKRRVKCSGTLPCSFCAEGDHACIYDNKHRGRRGPRPRRPPQPKVIHELAPAVSQETNAPPSNVQTGFPPPVPGRRQSHAVTSVPAKDPASARRAFSAGALPDFIEEAIEASDDEEEEEEEVSPSRRIPSLETWRPALERLFAGNESFWKAHTSMSTGFLCHLLELFYSHTSKHLKEVVPASYLFPALAAGHDIRPLILAMCANCARFSAHIAARSQSAGQQSVDVYLAESARRLVDLHSLRDVHHVDQVRTMCVLIELETSQSKGRSSWISIGIARSLVQLSWTSPSLTAEEGRVLESADDFLSLAGYLHSLGQPALQQFLNFGDSLRGANVRASRSSQTLLQLASLLVRVQRFCSQPLAAEDPRPWTAGSRFSMLQAELEEHILTHPGLFPATTEPPSDDMNAKDLEAAITLVMCHCTRIMLNKPFLPIPDPRSNATPSPEMHARCLNFPEAPTLFLMERARRCEASAAAICRSTQHVIGNGGFFSYMSILGFACTQSALVLINQLHRGSKPPCIRTVDKLKFAFLILAAVRKFHSPARHWLDVLFRAHDQKTPPADRTGNVKALFASYFSRYNDLNEPCFILLDADPPIPGSSSKPQTAAHQTAVAGSSPETPQVAQPPTSWVHLYSGHLSEDMQSDEEATTSRTETQEQSSTGEVSNTLQDSSYHVDFQQLPQEQSTQRAGVALMELATGRRTMPTGADVNWSDVGSDELLLSGILPPTPQFSDMMGMDLDVESLFGPIPLFDDSPEIWSGILNGAPFSG